MKWLKDIKWKTYEINISKICLKFKAICDKILFPKGRQISPEKQLKLKYKEEYDRVFYEEREKYIVKKARDDALEAANKGDPSFKDFIQKFLGMDK